MVSCCVTQWDAAGQDMKAGLFARPSSVLANLGAASAPSGLVSLCRREPSFCTPASANPAVATLTDTQLKLLQTVNDGVNHSIAATTDRALYGQDEYWTLPKTAGDCEDFVLMKRLVLVKLGVPEASLLITVVRDENGDSHAVLTVPTPAGDLVLDNRRDQILHWWLTGYSFIKRQSETDPLQWVSLGEEKLQATEIASGPGLP